MLSTLNEESFVWFCLKGRGILRFRQLKERHYVHVSDGKKWHEVDIPAPASKDANLLTYKKTKRLLDPLLC